MSQPKGARLWLEPEIRHPDGKLWRRATWVIRDGSRKIRTGCLREDRAGAERKLADHIAGKYQVRRDRNRHPSEIVVDDVLQIYMKDICPKHARPQETIQRILTLGRFWEPFTLADINGERCREYVKWRTNQTIKSFKHGKARHVTEATARRELEELRAAIKHHHKENYCSEIIAVAVPKKSSAGRETWLTRSQVARLLWAAWRARQIMRDKVTERDVGKHLARFILVGLYTGTRHAAICGAALHPAIDRGYVDLDRGVFHRKAHGARETKKRQPPVRLPARLLAHLRRWERLGIAIHAVVEWNGKPVRSVKKAFAAAAKAAGLPITGPDKVTPHVLRHTAATWAMAAGADLWQAAGFLGMTPEMLYKRYGHHDPDFQADTADRISSRPGRGRTKR